jgi:CrcB protein
VGVGGFFGAVLRYILSGFAQRISGSIDFPYGTLAVNLLGCVLIGMLSRMDEMRGLLAPETRLFLFIGILGSFTTFSTFGNETVNLINDKRFFLGLLNVGFHIVFGLAAVMLGRLSTYMIWR